MQTGAGFPWGSSLGLLVLDLAPTSPCLGVLCVTSPATGKAGEEGRSLSRVSSPHGSKPLKGRRGKRIFVFGEGYRSRQPEQVVAACCRGGAALWQGMGLTAAHAAGRQPGTPVPAGTACGTGCLLERGWQHEPRGKLPVSALPRSWCFWMDSPA